MNIILVYITAPSIDNAKHIVDQLLKKKLIACANIHTSMSRYWWEDALHSAEEAIIIAKTFEHCFNDIESEVFSIHPYSVPCILKIEAQATERFYYWMHTTTKSNEQQPL